MLFFSAIPLGKGNLEVNLNSYGNRKHFESQCCDTVVNVMKEVEAEFKISSFVSEEIWRTIMHFFGSYRQFLSGFDDAYW